MKVLLIGPFPDPLTGESLANEQLYRFLLKKQSTRFKVDLIDCSYREVSSGQGTFSVKKVMAFVKNYFAIYKILASDIVYITPGQTVPGILKYGPYMVFARLFRKKVVLHIHGGKLRFTLQETKGVALKLITSLLKLANIGIVLSKSLRNNLQGILRDEQITEVSNFAVDEIFDIAIENKDYSKIKVLYLSNLMVDKGILEVLEAYNQLKQYTDIEFYLAGAIDSSNQSEIEDAIRTSGINYLGVVRNEAKVEILEKSNVTILPTFYKTEGQPISLIEGMVAGNYIITTPHSGIPDIISDQNGRIVPQQETAPIVDAILNLQLNRDELIKKSRFNFEHSRALYTVENFGNSILKIFEGSSNK